MIEKPEFTGVNEGFEIIFNPAGTGNMNRAKVSEYKHHFSLSLKYFKNIPEVNKRCIITQINIIAIIDKVALRAFIGNF